MTKSLLLRLALSLMKLRPRPFLSTAVPFRARPFILMGMIQWLSLANLSYPSLKSAAPVTADSGWNSLSWLTLSEPPQKSLLLLAHLPSPPHPPLALLIENKSSTWDSFFFFRSRHGKLSHSGLLLRASQA